MKLVGSGFRWRGRRGPVASRPEQAAPLHAPGASPDNTFQALAESLPELVWTCHSSGACDYLSPQWEAFTGVPARALLGYGWLDALHPDDRPVVDERWRAACLSGTVYDIELRLRAASGDHRWFKTRAVPVRGAQGCITRWIGSCTDIHELHQANAALREERDRLKLIAATVPTIVCTFRTGPDGGGHIPFGAERLALIYGVPAELLRHDASCIAERIHPDDMVSMGAAMATSRAERTPWRLEFRVPHSPLGPMWLEAHFAPLPETDPDGGQTWHGSITDITERKRIEDDVRRFNVELEHRVRERTVELEAAVNEQAAFSYTVSHDLRAPLRALDGFSQQVLKEHGALLPESGRRYLRIIRESAQKMSQLIDDLLEFSRLGRQPLTMRPVDMAALVRDALDTLVPLRANRRIDLRISELPPSHGDLAMLRQVWVNLLSNALKYTRQRELAVVEVGFETLAGQTRYFVRDNGTGFDMRHANKLFGVFERLHRSEDFEGTGVGLAIVQRILLRHGGSVQAQGEVGQGATFSFVLDHPVPPPGH